MAYTLDYSLRDRLVDGLRLLRLLRLLVVLRAGTRISLRPASSYDRPPLFWGGVAKTDLLQVQVRAARGHGGEHACDDGTQHT